jgi:two-component system, NtrC family, response regulator HydG
MPNFRQPRVLVVDDEADTCANLSDILTDLGYHVDTAGDGREALDLVRKSAYDVALLDLKLPGMDGLNLYREIKRLRAGTVALLVTAYASSTTAEAALDAGAWQVLPKPVDLSQLLSAVDQALAEPMILIVDDDKELCDNLWQILRAKGYRVALAHDTDSVAEQVRETTYKVILIDMKLPGGDGSAIFRMVRDLKLDSRIILITGYRDETERLVQAVLSQGADGVCYKPFDLPQLLDQIARLAQPASLNSQAVRDQADAT